MEKRGIPTVLLAEDFFLPVVRASAKGRNFPQVRTAVFPGGSVRITTKEELRQMTDKAFTDVVRGLTKGQ